MADIYLTNSLTRKKEKFKSIKKSKVGIYTCGPTVYNFVSIGNWRTYFLGDALVRTLKFLGFSVNYIMNITDVGHLTGDNLGDADIGEDRIEKAAKRERKSAWDVAKLYTEDFLEGFQKLNLALPKKFTKATEHIKDQITLVKKIEKRGFTYKTKDGLYFDTEAYEQAGYKYGELSTLDQIREGARVKKNIQKKNPRDFALWKFSKKKGLRHMEWESPWGLGFPGWHIECSAMSMKYLGDQFDIHVGGEDLRSTHHPNEIAQSEAATDKIPFVKYWLHGTFLKVDGERMGRSLRNFYTLTDVEKKGFDVLSLRYLFLTSHYKDSLNFTWKSLEAAQKGLNNLRSQVAAAKTQTSRTALSEEKRKELGDFQKKFIAAISDDLNMPQALATLWATLKSNIPPRGKYDLILSFDEVLGLNLMREKEDVIPPKLKVLLSKRERLRKSKKFDLADEIRKKIGKLGYSVIDTPNGSKLKKDI